MPYLNCLHCGNSFYARPSMIKQGFGKYCSKSCSNTHNNPSLSNKISPEIEQAIIEAYQSGMSKREAAKKFGYSRGATEKILKRNGIQPRTVSESLKGRIFSPEHKQKIRDAHHNVSGKNSPMFGITSPNPNGWGKRTYVEALDISFRSTWEANVAKVLTELNISFEYEKRRIKLSDCSTLVDFYLPHYDCYLEIKGRVNDHFKHVLQRIKEEKPNIKYVVLYEDDYQRLIVSPNYIYSLL